MAHAPDPTRRRTSDSQEEPPIHRDRLPSFEDPEWKRRNSGGHDHIFSSVPRERPRSQPSQVQFRKQAAEFEKGRRGSGSIGRESFTISSGSGPNVTVHLHESKSAELKRRGGAGDEPNVTRHDLYKEAMYTAVHMLGLPSPKRFPSTQEEMCMYVHEAFSANETEQQVVVDHVRDEPFPLTIVNTRIRRAEGLQGPKPNGIVDSYCLVTIETADSGVIFQLGRREWQNFSTATPVKRAKGQESYKKNMRPPPEERAMQIYEKVPPFIKTTVQRQKKNPEWDQRFQCLILRPSVDKLIVEVWDHSVDDKYVAKTIRNYTDQDGSADLDATLQAAHANEDRKKGDVFLGKVTVHGSEIPCDGIDNWYYLTSNPKTKGETHGKIRLQIWLVHAYRHGRNFAEIAEPKVILEHLWDWVLKTEKANFSDPSAWDGAIPAPATCLLFQYALQNGISEDTHAIIRWNAYAKYDLNMHSVEGRLHELNEVITKQIKTQSEETGEPPKPPSRVRNSQADIEENLMGIMKNKIFPIIRNHLREDQDVVHDALKSYHESLQILSRFETPFFLQNIQWLFDAAIRMAILEWYAAIYTSTVPSRGEVQKSDYVNSVVKVMMEVNALLKLGEAKWSPQFWLIASVEYLPVVYDELQKMVIHDVEAICWLFFEHYHNNKKLRKILLRHDEKDKELCTAFFNLYTQTQIFVLAQLDIFGSEPRAYCCINNYHRWFRPTLVLWLGFALIKGSSMISKTINIDNHVQDNEHAMTSSSALDTEIVFCQLVSFWNALNWPDVSEGYVIIHFLMDVICSFTILYAELKHAKLDKDGYYDPQGRFMISERLCTALNNIEYVKEYVQRVPQEINYEHIVELLEEACGKSRLILSYEERTQETREKTVEMVDQHIDDILDNIGLRLQRDVTAFIEESFRGLIEVSSDNLNNAMEPIIAYLEENIITLQKCMLRFNFLKFLKLLWKLVCRGLLINARRFVLANTSSQVEFFQRILEVIPYLQSYFNGNDGGLPMAEMNTREFQEMERQFSYFTMSTEELIEIYFNSEGLGHLKDMESPHLGTLRIRIGYWNNKLGVEVISAAQLTPHDEPFPILKYFHQMYATSDPFVQLELKPISTFPNAKKHETTVQWKNLNPTFGESFYWSDVTPEDCLKPAASLLLTVKDYDLLSKNAFLGEVIVPLHMIPGISSNPQAQPMTLNLQQTDMDHPVLTVLKSRQEWDMTAKQFCQEQFSRFVERAEEK